MDPLQRDFHGLGERVSAMEEKLKAVHQRVDEQKDLALSVHKLALSMERLTHELAFLRNDQLRQRAELDEIRLKPGKRWESITGEILRLAVAALLGSALMRIGG